jgi:hypothetical protein
VLLDRLRAYDPAQKVALGVTVLVVAAAVGLTLLPFHNDEGIPCGPPIVAWRDAAAGGGVPGELDQGPRGPCVDEARSRLLGGSVGALLAVIGGKVGIDLLGTRGVDRDLT